MPVMVCWARAAPGNGTQALASSLSAAAASMPVPGRCRALSGGCRRQPEPSHGARSATVTVSHCQAQAGRATGRMKVILTRRPGPPPPPRWLGGTGGTAGHDRCSARRARARQRCGRAGVGPIWILARTYIVRLRTMSYVVRHRTSEVRRRSQHRTYDIVRTMLRTTLNIRHHTFVNIVGLTYDIVG